MKFFLNILFIVSVLLAGCKTDRTTPQVIPGTHAVAKPIPTVTETQIHETASTMAGLSDSSRNAAVEIKGNTAQIQAAVDSGAAGTVSPQEVAKAVEPKTQAIGSLSDTIQKDQDLLRKKLGDAEAEVLKMRKEIDRLAAESSSIKAAYESDIKNIDAKYQGELVKRETVIKEKDDVIAL